MSAATFDAGWLGLRATYDAAATGRGPAAVLARDFGAALRRRQERGVLRLCDLGGGTGANVCRLAPRIPGSQHWTVVDNDAGLLAAVADTVVAWARSIGGHVDADADSVSVTTPQRIVTVTVRHADLRQGLAGLPLTEMDGATGSALLDFVSDDWLAGAVAALATHRLPALFTLNVDGTLAWRPALASDREIAAAFSRDLSRDKGFGPALGARAAAAAMAEFAARGYAVSSARSDWQVAGADAPMLQALLSFVEPAALSQAPEGEADDAWRPRIAAWAAARRAQIAAGTVSLTVGHVDLLALM